MCPQQAFSQLTYLSSLLDFTLSKFMSLWVSSWFLLFIIFLQLKYHFGWYSKLKGLNSMLAIYSLNLFQLNLFTRFSFLCVEALDNFEIFISHRLTNKQGQPGYWESASSSSLFSYALSTNVLNSCLLFYNMDNWLLTASNIPMYR